MTSNFNFSDYEAAAGKTAIYPNRGNNLVYPTLGLAGEVGEIPNKVKKIYRDNEGELSSEMRDALIGELGDVLWYIASMCFELDVPMSEVASRNIQKLESRQARNKIQGSGDNR